MSRPVVLLDVMDTIVWDPYRLIPEFFGTKDWRPLFEARDRSAWLEYERGEIDEQAFLDRFFIDGRPFDKEGLRRLMFDNYRWLDGMESLLGRLCEAGTELHALSNYPDWYLAIEDRLGLSRYLKWTFVSCLTGVRKPDAEAYLGPVRRLGRPADELIFVDDRTKNVDAARAAGLHGVLFEGAASLERSLKELGAL
ncbi:MAG: HAD-IA family hydrolase [Deltaproteobacteria bacterium]|nr:HAD-IA family hydrolase [Deltaproteobacteria bacterium]